MHRRTETLASILQALAKATDTPYTVTAAQNSTLNEYFNVGKRTSVPNKYPAVNYIALGIGGEYNEVGLLNKVITKPKVHQLTNAAAFEHIPFLLVPLANDLSADARANYRMRVIETYDGTQYAAYYVKPFIMDATTTTNIVTISNKNITSTVEYNPITDNSRQTPIPVITPNVNSTVDIIVGKNLIVQSTYKVHLSETDIQNIIDACIIKFGDAAYAKISEIMTVSGYDEPNTSDDGITYTELRCAEITTISNTAYELQYAADMVIPFAITKSVPIYPIATS
jgi:hypothetical protein